ncbi:MAG: DUF2934 domain-containing protein [Magnetococcus sp. DMHC-1]|nr:DUF2934 domain-containing protein [Magnetococcales bacterium]
MNKLSREERIRQKAHDLWEQSGRPDGQGEKHWFQATQMVDQEMKAEQSAAPDPIPESGTKKKATRTRKKAADTETASGAEVETKPKKCKRVTKKKDA